MYFVFKKCQPPRFSKGNVDCLCVPPLWSWFKHPNNFWMCWQENVVQTFVIPRGRSPLTSVITRRFLSSAIRLTLVLNIFWMDYEVWSTGDACCNKLSDALIFNPAKVMTSPQPQLDLQGKWPLANVGLLTHRAKMMNNIIAADHVIVSMLAHWC